MTNPQILPLKDYVLAFDLDGTLVDTAPDIIGALNTILIEDGITPFALDKARPMIGKGARELLRKAFLLAGEPLSLKTEGPMLERFLSVYESRISELSRPYDGLIDSLDRLESLGARFCVCTNKPQNLSLLLLEKLGLLTRFGAVFGADAVTQKKPDPAHLWAPVDAMSGNRQKVIMIGDSETDFQTGRNAGVPVILFTHGYSEIDLETLCADALLDHFDGLEAAILRLQAVM